MTTGHTGLLRRRLLPWLAASCITAMTTTLAAGASAACGPDRELEPQSGRCAAVTDRRSDFAAQAQHSARPPSLAVLRAAGARARQSARTAGSAPTPGGFGAGTAYRTGSLAALVGGELYTHMLIHPDGLRLSTGGLDWLFTTATNRVGQGVEVVGIYQRWSGTSHLGVFDWSCAAAFPCEGGIDQASWIWTRELATFACNTTVTDAGNGTLHRTLYYRNGSRRLDAQTIPLWRNQVLLWNYCSNGWDLVYRHDYRVQQEDCSRTGACAWWGPILETFEFGTGEAYPAIRELGFDGTRLLHDGQWSNLPPTETEFVAPHAPWALGLLEPNRAFTAGNYPIRKIGFEVGPGRSMPCVDPASRGEVRAAIIGAPGFSAAYVDVASIGVGRLAARALRPQLVDVNADRRPDLVFRFIAGDTGLARGEVTLPVIARMRSGNDIGGLDAIRVGTCP